MSQRGYTKLPFRRFFSLVIVVLVIIDFFKISVQTEDINQGVWKFSISPSISTTTVVLLLTLVLLFLAPWLIEILQSTQMSQIFRLLRNEGIEEIETNILRIKLNTGTQASVDAYEASILRMEYSDYFGDPKEFKQEFDKAYTNLTKLTEKSQTVSPGTAIQAIDELAKYYDTIREILPSSRKRTDLLDNIAATMWSLLSQVNIFPLMEYLNSSSGGKRIAAYKYIESKPTTDVLDNLLTRAIGVLEVRYGQYSALVALQRSVSTLTLDVQQKMHILAILRWQVQQDHMKSAGGRLRRMKAVISSLEELR